MARTFRGVTLRPSTDKPRPKPTSPLHHSFFFADLGQVIAERLDADSIILIPIDFNLYESNFTGFERWQETCGPARCWKTTRCYEQIGETHARIVEFKRRDPYTAFPVLARPSGPTLVRLLDEHGATMYSSPVDAPSSRILPEYLPLVYQWALDIITGLDFVHSHDVIFGEVSPNQCWLDSNYRVSLLGFINAGFLDKQRWSAVVESDWEDEQLSKGLPTRETDLMLFGYVVYELMTAYAPAIRSGMRPWKNRNVNVPKHQWPRLETAYMGDIVRKCWSGEFASTEEVKTAVVDFLKGLGWEIDADDRLKGLDTKVLFT